MKKIILASLLLSGALISGFGAASSLPRRVAADSHIKMVQYDPNNVVRLNGEYGFQTQVAFAPDEVVQNVSLGDSMAWQAVPVGSNLFIKPVAASTTNMTVLTNKNSYNFQLDSEHQKGSPTYKLQFIYPEAGFDPSGISNGIASFNPEKINWKYSFTGEKELAPEAIFDNGQFTYFKFDKDRYNRMPSIFIVDKNRHETLVNYHMQGNYVVVNTVAKAFALRDGDLVSMVYNNYAIGDWNKV